MRCVADWPGPFATVVLRKKSTMTSDEQKNPKTALMDAAERLLIEKGYDAVSTRVVAAEAGVNHGLVHYYFGSVDNLLLATVDRFTEQLIVRQRAMYAEDRPFIEKWRTAMDYLQGEDRDSGYEKLWLEMQAMAWNRPEMKAHVAEINTKWREVLVDAFSVAMDDYGIDQERFPVEAIVALVSTFNEGMQMEQIGGVTQGHTELLGVIDALLMYLEANKPTK